jgi:PAS domain S-box-containing protein
MPSNASGAERERDLRLRALKHLMEPGSSRDKRPDASAALGVLHDLALSPLTADAALTLLHELQVHQVELDLQDEELRRSRAELEATLSRLVQLYDLAPLGYVTVDRGTTVREMNLTAAVMLGSGRESLLGRTLDSFLEPRSALALHTMLNRLTDGAPRGLCALQLATPHDGEPRNVHASATRDPEGRHFLVAFVDVAERKASTADYPQNYSAMPGDSR